VERVLKMNDPQYHILHKKMRTGNSTGLNSKMPLKMFQRTVFLKKGEWK
jgi:hypothetical protein